MNNPLVFPVFEFSDVDSLGAMMGIYTTVEGALEAARIAANSENLYYEKELVTEAFLNWWMADKEQNLVVKGDNQVAVIIFYAPLDTHFISTN